LAQLLLPLAPPPAPTFDNFVVGRNAQAMAELRRFGSDNERCLYLFGAQGSGRTHVLQAWAQLHSATIVNANASKRPFHGFFQDIGVEAQYLAVDDCQALDEADQIGLFNAYNRARRGEAYLLVTGDAPPMQLNVREDVRTRLAWGVALEVFALDDDERIAALLQHANARGMKLGAGVVEYLAVHSRRDMPSVMTWLDALDTASLQAKRPVTLALVRELLRGHEAGA
jgi:DnaA-homolog protein